uniref:Integrase catalytic domain-containing protein n=1 Tax=Amphimedon queenslandica TaxID=400682 RepID=A0A1X7TCZ0_AMPQE
MIKNSFYVDDVITGAARVSEAFSLYKLLKDLSANGRFNLQNFFSNNVEPLLLKWKQLLTGLLEQPLRLAQCCTTNDLGGKARFIGVCDASFKAYAAMVYLENCDKELDILASKTKVSPLKFSDNGATFESAAKVIPSIQSHNEVQRYFSNVDLKWSFNTECAQWWSGFFESMVQLLKCCLHKILVQFKLTYDEILPSVTEVEIILKSHPLTYITASGMDDPVTASHLTFGKRLMSLPEYLSLPDSEEFS